MNDVFPLFTTILLSLQLLPRILGFSPIHNHQPFLMQQHRRRAPVDLSLWQPPTFTTSLFATSDDFMEELRHRIDEEYASYIPIQGAATKVQQPQQPQQQPEEVYIVVIQAGTVNQGAHTIEYPKGSGNNVVLAFKSWEPCAKFASLLEEQQHFVDPQPQPYRWKDVETFFSKLGVTVQCVPDGVDLKPPRQNVPKFGHDPALCQTKKQLEWLFEMTDEGWEEMGMLLPALEESSTTTTTTTTGYTTTTTGAWE